jgi:hypothetical protein
MHGIYFQKNNYNNLFEFFWKTLQISLYILLNVELLINVQMVWSPNLFI